MGNSVPARPPEKWRVKIEGVDEHVRVQKNHDLRVSSRSFSHVIVGCRGALRMATMQALLVMRVERLGFSSRTIKKRPSASQNTPALSKS